MMFSKEKCSGDGNDPQSPVSPMQTYSGDEEDETMKNSPESEAIAALKKQIFSSKAFGKLSSSDRLALRMTDLTIELGLLARYTGMKLPAGYSQVLAIGITEDSDHDDGDDDYSSDDSLPVVRRKRIRRSRGHYKHGIRACHRGREEARNIGRRAAEPLRAAEPGCPSRSQQVVSEVSDVGDENESESNEWTEVDERCGLIDTGASEGSKNTDINGFSDSQQGPDAPPMGQFLLPLVTAENLQATQKEPSVVRQEDVKEILSTTTVAKTQAGLFDIKAAIPSEKMNHQLSETEALVVSPEEEATLLQCISDEWGQSRGGCWTSCGELLQEMFNWWSDHIKLKDGVLSNMAKMYNAREWSYSPHYACHCHLCLGCVVGPINVFIKDILLALANSGEHTMRDAVIILKALKCQRARSVINPNLWEIPPRFDLSDKGAQLVYEILLELSEESSMAKDIVNKVCACRPQLQPLSAENAVTRLCTILENFKAASVCPFRIEMDNLNECLIINEYTSRGLTAYLKTYHSKVNTRLNMYQCDCMTPKTLCVAQQEAIFRTTFVFFIRSANYVNQKIDLSNFPAPYHHINQGGPTAPALQQGTPTGTGAKPPDAGYFRHDEEPMSCDDSCDQSAADSDEDCASSLSSLGSVGEILSMAETAVDYELAPGPGEMAEIVKHLIDSMLAIETVMDRILTNCVDWPRMDEIHDVLSKEIQDDLMDVDKMLMDIYERLPAVHEKQVQVYQRHVNMAAICTELLGGSAPPPPSPGDDPPRALLPRDESLLLPEYHLISFNEVRRKVLHMRDLQLYNQQLRAWVAEQHKHNRRCKPQKLTMRDFGPRRPRKRPSAKLQQLTEAARRKLRPQLSPTHSQPRNIFSFVSNTEKTEAEVPKAFKLGAKGRVESKETVLTGELLNRLSNVNLQDKPADRPIPESISPPLQAVSPTTESVPVYTPKPSQRLLNVNKILGRNTQWDSPYDVPSKPEIPDMLNVSLMKTRRTPLLVENIVNKRLQQILGATSIAPNLNRIVYFGIEIKKAIADCKTIASECEVREENTEIVANPKVLPMARVAPIPKKVDIDSDSSDNDIATQIPDYSDSDDTSADEVDEEDTFKLQQITEVMISLANRATEYINNMKFTSNAQNLQQARANVEYVKGIPAMLKAMPEITAKLTEYAANASKEISIFVSALEELPETDDESQLTPETRKQIRDLKLKKRSVKGIKNKRKLIRSINELNSTIDENIHSAISLGIHEDSIRRMAQSKKDLDEMWMGNKEQNSKVFKEVLLSITGEVIINNVFDQLKENTYPDLAKCFDEFFYLIEDNEESLEIPRPVDFKVFEDAIKSSFSMPELMQNSRYAAWKYCTEVQNSGPRSYEESESLLNIFCTYVQKFAMCQSPRDRSTMLAKIDDLRYRELVSTSVAKPGFGNIVMCNRKVDTTIMKISNMKRERRGTQVRNVRFKFSDILRCLCENIDFCYWVITDPEMSSNLIMELVCIPNDNKNPDLPDVTELNIFEKITYFLSKLDCIKRLYMSSLPKKKISVDEWLLTLYRLQQLEDGAKDMFRKIIAIESEKSNHKGFGTFDPHKHLASFLPLGAQLQATRLISPRQSFNSTQVIQFTNQRTQIRSTTPTRAPPADKIQMQRKGPQFDTRPQGQPRTPARAQAQARARIRAQCQQSQIQIRSHTQLTEAEIVGARGLSKMINEAKKVDDEEEKDTEKHKLKKVQEIRIEDNVVTVCKGVMDPKSEKGLEHIKTHLIQGLSVPDKYKKLVPEICECIDIGFGEEGNPNGTEQKVVIEKSNGNSIQQQCFRKLPSLIAKFAEKQKSKSEQEKVAEELCDDKQVKEMENKQTKAGDEKKRPVAARTPVKGQPSRPIRSCENSQHVCKIVHAQGSCPGDGTHHTMSSTQEQTCTCCYCTVFGQAPQNTMPVSRNYTETRERLLYRLSKKKQQQKAATESLIAEKEQAAAATANAAQSAEAQTQPNSPKAKVPANANKQQQPKTMPSNFNPNQQNQMKASETNDTQQTQLTEKMAKMAVSDTPKGAVKQQQPLQQHKPQQQQQKPQEQQPSPQQQQLPPQQQQPKPQQQQPAPQQQKLPPQQQQLTPQQQQMIQQHRLHQQHMQKSQLRPQPLLKSLLQRPVQPGSVRAPLPKGQVRAQAPQQVRPQAQMRQGAPAQAGQQCPSQHAAQDANKQRVMNQHAAHPQQPLDPKKQMQQQRPPQPPSQSQKQPTQQQKAEEQAKLSRLSRLVKASSREMEEPVMERQTDTRDLDALLQYIEGPARHIDKGKKKAKKQRQKAKKMEASLIEQHAAIMMKLTITQHMTQQMRACHAELVRRLEAPSQRLAQLQPPKKKGKKQKQTSSQRTLAAITKEQLGELNRGLEEIKASESKIAHFNNILKELEEKISEVQKIRGPHDGAEPPDEADLEYQQMRTHLLDEHNKILRHLEEQRKKYQIETPSTPPMTGATLEPTGSGMIRVRRVNPPATSQIEEHTVEVEMPKKHQEQKKNTWDDVLQQINDLAADNAAKEKKKKDVIRPELKAAKQTTPTPEPEQQLSKKQRRLLAKQQAEAEEQKRIKEEEKKQKREKYQQTSTKQAKQQEFNKKDPIKKIVEPTKFEKKEEKKKPEQKKGKENKEKPAPPVANRKKSPSITHSASTVKNNNNNKKKTPTLEKSAMTNIHSEMLEIVGKQVNPNSCSLLESKPASCSIMEQLSSGVQVADLKLPPGITLTRVQPNEKKETPVIKSVPAWKSNCLAAAPTPVAQPPPFINAEPSLMTFSTAHPEPPKTILMPEPVSVPMIGKSKKAKKKAKKAAEQEAQKSEGTKMITLRNPMFHPNLPPVQVTTNQQKKEPARNIPEPIPMPPNPCQATITPISNGMYTIRNPYMSMMHQQAIGMPNQGQYTPTPQYGPGYQNPNNYAQFEAKDEQPRLNLAAFTQKNEDGYSLFQSDDKCYKNDNFFVVETKNKAQVSPNPIGTRPNKDGASDSLFAHSLDSTKGADNKSEYVGGFYTPFGVEDKFRSALFSDSNDDIQTRVADEITNGDSLPYFQRLRVGAKLNNEVTIHHVNESKSYNKSTDTVEVTVAPKSEEPFARPFPAKSWTAGFVTPSPSTSTSSVSSTHFMKSSNSSVYDSVSNSSSNSPQAEAKDEDQGFGAIGQTRNGVKAQQFYPDGLHTSVFTELSVADVEVAAERENELKGFDFYFDTSSAKLNYN